MCPEEFCFQWVSAGGKVSPPGKRYASSREAVLDSVNWPVEPVGRCACSFGTCLRSGLPGATTDFYEPCEPRLEAAGLPWFYFCNPACLTQEFQEAFRRESEALWGRPITDL